MLQDNLAEIQKLLTHKFIDSIWVSNRSNRLREDDKDRPCVITHISDLENLFLDNDLLKDEEYIICSHLVVSFIFPLLVQLLL